MADLYKREDDKKWRDSTNDRITALTASEAVQNDRLDEIEERIENEFVQILRGKPGDKDGGLEGDVRELERAVRNLQAIMVPDSLGNGGVIARIKALEKKEDREARSLEYRWKFYVALLSLVGLVIGTLIKEWPEIRSHWPKDEKVVAAPAKPKRKVRRPKPIPQPVIEEEVPSAESQTGD